MTEKTKEEILQDVFEEIENACMNIKKDLQANKIVLSYEDTRSLADKFFDVLRKHNSKVNITGDGK